MKLHFAECSVVLKADFSLLGLKSRAIFRQSYVLSIENVLVHNKLRDFR